MWKTCDASLRILQTCSFTVGFLLHLSPLCLPHPIALHFQYWWIKLELENLKIIDEH